MLRTKASTLLGCCVLLASCATTPPAAHNKTPYQFVPSAKQGYNYKYGNFYLEEPKGLSATKAHNELRNCQKKGKEYVAAKSQGYLVLRSLGTSDRSQIASTALDCLNTNGWTIYEYTNAIYYQVESKAIDNYFLGAQ